MSSSVINPKDSILSMLLEEGFWLDAFDQGAPFYDSYTTYFKKGIIDEIPNVLDIHWEAIYYLNDFALTPIIIRLIQIATKHPKSSFIESLSFFLSKENQQNRLITAFSSIGNKTIDSLIKNIELLSSYLTDMDDIDIATELLVFQSLLKKVRAK